MLTINGDTLERMAAETPVCAFVASVPGTPLLVGFVPGAPAANAMADSWEELAQSLRLLSRQTAAPTPDPGVLEQV